MTDVAIVGAGPIGLFLGALLGKRGRSVQIYEQKPFPSPGSNAIGVTPPSLVLLDRIGAAEPLIRSGAPIRDVEVFGKNGRLLGTADFRGLEKPYDFILAVPQSTTESLLERALEFYPSVQIERGQSFKSLEQKKDRVVVRLARTETSKDASSGDKTLREEEFRYLVACDGAKSSVREVLGLSWRPRRYKPTFLMADFFDETGWGGTAKLFFTPEGAVESFPHAEGWRRWIVQTPRFLENPGDFLEEAVHARTGTILSPARKGWQSAFGVQRWVAPRYDFDRVFLAGDSAHQMSPIGGQGMNTGFADAEFLASLLNARLEGALSDRDFLVSSREYSRFRRRAALTAAARAELSMRVGTVTGRVSIFRDAFLSWILKGPVRRAVAPHYAMRTLCNRDLTEIAAHYPGLVRRLKEFL